MANPVVPIPLREMLSGEFPALLAIEILPDAAPAEAGANWT